MTEASTAENGVSVLIPAHNPNIDDIKQILIVLANQTYKDFEIIIANDGDDFYDAIRDILVLSPIPFQYKKNEKRLGLYFSIKENLRYCNYDNVLVLEQDIIPLSQDYIKSLIALLQSCPQDVVTSRLMIDAETDYKKYVFYKRRISNLGTIDHSKKIDGSFSNVLLETEVTFTKADLMNKHILIELFSTGSSDSNTSQDIILSTIVRRDRRLVTSDATSCEIGHSDPNTFSFFLKKEYLYGKSVFAVWRHSDKDTLISTSYFKEKLSRILFVIVETIAIIFGSLEFFIGGTLALPLLIVILGLGLFYTQAVLVHIKFWDFWRRNQRSLTKIVKSTFYVVLLDVAYTLGILRRLL